jgi:alpha-ribazole phosphatase
MRIHLLRHGEVQGGSRYWGETDVALSKIGWQQMRAAVAGQTWDFIASSPLRRCATFAEVLARELTVPFRLEAELREMSFGAWEGRSAFELMRSDPESLLRFWTDPSQHAPPGGETLAQLHARVWAVWQRLVVTYNPGRLLIITHGGPIRVLRGVEKQIPSADLLKIEVPHAALLAIDCLPDGRITPLREVLTSPLSREPN